MSWDDSIEAVLAHEGGYVDDPADPGGRTKFGISQRQYPDLDIASLTEDQAREIYRSDYWEPIRGDDLPEAVAHVVFDCAVNQGVSYATRLMQRIAGVEQDGIIGPITLAAVRELPADQFVEQYQVARLRRYASLPHWQRFGAGWSIRAVRVLAQALRMA